MAESWERGVPALCSDILAFKELKSTQSELEKSLVFKVGNVQDLRHKIDYFINNKVALTNLEYRNSLHSFVSQNYSNDRMASNYRKLFSNLIKEGNV